MKSESFFHPRRTRRKKRNARHSPQPTQIQPSSPLYGNTPFSSPTHSDTHTAIKAHFKQLIHSTKHKSDKYPSGIRLKATDSFSSSSSSFLSCSSRDESHEAQHKIRLHGVRKLNAQLVYEHELVDGVVSDVESGEVCVVLEVGVARVVGVERVPWWEVGVVDLDLSVVDGKGELDRERARVREREEEIGRAF